MSAWWEGELIALDTESTGTDPRTAAIVTAHVSLVNPDGTAVGRTLVIDPGVPVPDAAAAVHGFTTERLQAEGMERTFGLGVLYGLLRRFVGRVPIVAMNAAYDCTLIDRELRRVNLQPLPFDAGPVIDPLVIDKELDTYRRGKRTLGAMCELYGVELADAHEASSDALAAVGVARALGRRYARQQITPSASELHEQQRAWRRRQCDSLRAYFDRSGIAHDGVPGDWPVLPGELLPIGGA